MKIDDAVAEAHRAVAEAVGASYERRRFTVSKFGRHPDGYLHARVVVDGKPFYFHRRFGSWLAPGQLGHHPVLKEPEALLGGPLGREVKFALSDKSRPFDTADRHERERIKNDRTPRPAPNAGGRDEAGAAPGVPAPGDPGNAPVTISHDTG